MASAVRSGFWRRRQITPAQTFTVSSPGRTNGPWALTSSATRLDVADRREAKVQRMLRQGWQSEAWGYRARIGELRYAVNFLANTTARMRIYPACYPVGKEADMPVALQDVLDPAIPPEVVSASGQAIQALGNGRMAISGMLHRLSSSKTVAGESYLLGRTDPQTGEETWSVRSINELVVYDDKWHLREIPDDRQNGIIPWIPLDPNLTMISRMWTPDPEYELLADSALRAMLDDCESLTILRRMIRGTGRSRLASRGLLLVPQELSLKVPVDDDGDPEADPFMAMLAQAMMAPIETEGAAEGVVPIVVRGPAEFLDKVRMVDMSGAFDQEASKTRAELLGVLARSLDMPPEVLTGLSDVNHWTAWQISDDTFRQIEPHVIACCDDLTAAFYRPFLQALGVDPLWVNRMVLWYDPAEVVTHPDQTADAKDLYDRHAISALALARTAGFAPEDMPTPEETVIRMLQNMRTPPPNLVMAAVHQMFPTLTIPPVSVAGTIPGVKPTGVDPGDEPAPALPAAPGAPGAPAPAPVAIDDAPPAKVTQPSGEPGPPPVTAAGMNAAHTQSARLSRKLSAIDSDLRARLQTAANAAMRRQLERAGARLRTRVARDETLRTPIAHRANERVSAILGPDVVTAAGLSATELIGNDWSGLRAQFMAWTQAAQEQAIATALRMGELDEDAAAAARATAAMAAGRDAAWELLSEALTSLGHNLLYSPDPSAGPTDWATLNPDTLVPTGMIRAALGVAGGAPTSAVTLDPSAGTLSTSGYVGQVGTGSTVSDLLTSAGGTTAQFQWSHGPSLHPFEPHLALDGVEFAQFDDPALASTDDELGNAFYIPGDHQGCLCDVTPLWEFPGSPVTDSSATGGEE